MRTRDLDYDLPDDLVATRPASPRDAARMLVHRRRDGSIEHAHVRDLPAYLGAEDLLVANDTAVAAARLVGRRADSDGRVSGLFLGLAAADGATWRCLLRSNGRLREGARIVLEPGTGGTGRDPGADSISIEVAGRDGDAFLVRAFDEAGRAPAAPAEAFALLERAGRTPLPPYILRARRARGGPEDEPDDPQRYQTVYADPERRGSVAAPTAGLHFTPELLGRLDARGVRRTSVTLHVGAGTFKPVEAERLDDHDMHAEWYEVSPEAIAALVDPAVRRVVAVGTTSVRTLESLPVSLPAAGEGPLAAETDLLIAPGWRWRHVDAMLTNFHLPRSTLLALVAAFIGLDEMHRIYRIAVEARYRFYSYGDAMLLL